MTHIKKIFTTATFLTCSLFGLTLNTAPSAQAEALRCSGFSFEVNTDNNPELSTPSAVLNKVAEVLTDGNESQFEDQWTYRRYTFADPIITYTFNRKGDVFYSTDEMLAIRKAFPASLFKNREIDCEYDPTIIEQRQEMREKEEEGPDDPFCAGISSEEIAKNPLYASCDPLWTLKQMQVLQKNNNGEWTKDWISDLLFERKSILYTEASLLEQQGKADEAKLKRQQADMMRSEGISILIGMPDTGYTHHPEIGLSHLSAPENYADGPAGDDGAYDTVGGSLLGFQHGHGSAMASTLISPQGRQIENVLNEGDPNQFVDGMVPGALIRPYRVAESTVIHFSFNHLIDALMSVLQTNMNQDQLSTKRVRVLSMSLGGAFPRKQVERLLDLLNEQGVVSVAAAGNFIPSIVGKFVIYPAKYEQTIAAAATDINKNPWQHSSRGKSVDIAAPGVDVWSAHVYRQDKQDAYGIQRSKGTSYATAFTAGTLALWLAFHGELALAAFPKDRHLLFRYMLDQLKAKGKLTKIECDQYKSSCDNIEDGEYGRGILNVKALLEEPLPTPEQFARYVEDIRDREKALRDANAEDGLSADARSHLKAISNIYDEEFNEDEIAMGLYEVFGPFDPKSEGNEEFSAFLENEGFAIMVHLVESNSLQEAFGDFVNDNQNFINLRNRAESERTKARQNLSLEDEEINKQKVNRALETMYQQVEGKLQKVKKMFKSVTI